MDTQSQTVQPSKPISDDQELAKVLAGITGGTNDNMGFEETPVAKTTTPMPPMMPPMPPAKPAPAPMSPPEPDKSAAPQMPPVEPVFNYDESMAPKAPQIQQPPQLPVASNLEGIRKDALTELRPLVDKLDLAPDEKFDIYLLLLRSTDDTALIAPAHEAAKNIADESKRAQALLDIIKEIDFLSSPTSN